MRDNEKVLGSAREVDFQVGNIGDVENTVLAASLGNPLASALLIAVGKAIAKQAAKQIGAAIISEIFGSDQIDYNQLLDDIRNIVREENARQTAGEQGGNINGVITNINEIYNRHKDDGDSRKVLFDLLENSYLSELNKSLGVLTQPDFEQFGLPIYVQAASVKFCVLQEMILQDPDHYWRPKKSSVIPVYTQFIDDAIRHVESLHSSALESRLEQISNVKTQTMPITAYVTASFKDNFTGKKYKAEGLLSKDKMLERREELIQELKNEVAWFDALLAEWREAQKQPLAFLDV